MSLHLERPLPGEFKAAFEKYIFRVPDGDIAATLKRQGDETVSLLNAIPEQLGDHSYASGKWTIKEVVGHICDCERIFSYRLLRFSRADQTPLAGFDENAYIPTGCFRDRTLTSLIGEFTAVRASTAVLVAALPREVWSRGGIAGGSPVSVRALAYIIAGHELHHREVLLTRYLKKS